MQCHCRWRVFLFTAALTALAGGWIAPTKAHAGCGDGVGSLNDMGKGHDVWARAGTASNSTQAMRPSHHHDKPCDGPACKRGSVPLVPAVPPAPPSVQEWSCLPALLALLQPVPGVYFSDSHLSTPARQPRAIFHPPRVSSSLHCC